MDWDAPSRLDKAEDRRADGEWVASLWSAAEARVLAVDPDGRIDWDGDRPAFRPTMGGYRDGDHVLLGLLDVGGAREAPLDSPATIPGSARAGQAGGEAAASPAVVDQGVAGATRGVPVFAERAELSDAPTLRAVMDALTPDDLACAFAATALVGWHAATGFCGWCGAPTVPTLAGQARRCTGCGREAYPRVDPAVIVAITDADDRLLLGRQASWAQGRVSVFAGFTEAGESLEQAVHREVLEEVGLPLEQVRYLGSQPWPFPRSLMLGFAARAASVEIVLDPREIAEARWFSREALTGALASGEVTLPMTTSIAYRMITAWQQARLG
jgi:NAD+ diphosphatase